MKKGATKLLLTAIIAMLGMTMYTSVYAEVLTPELCKEKATAAAKLIEEKGEAAFAEIKDPNGPFMFAEGQGYIWIQSADNMMIMHPIKPEMDGTSLIEYQDINGMYIFVAFTDTAEENGAGWVPYSWTKPGQQTESPKVSYVVKAVHGGKTYIAGCGIYDVTGNDIKAKFPDDFVYEE